LAAFFWPASLVGMFDKLLIPLAELARQLHVEPKWLASEAKAGRLPHLNAGGRLLFHRPTVERLLLRRAGVKCKTEGQEPANA
jgi:hypothetical protein